MTDTTVEGVDAAEVAENIAAYLKDCILLDVREEDEYVQGHIPGAVNIPLSELHGRMNEMRKDKRVLLICLSGGRAKVASKLLSSQGYGVMVLNGGMRSWKGPLERPKRPVPGSRS